MPEFGAYETTEEKEEKKPFEKPSRVKPKQSTMMEVRLTQEVAALVNESDMDDSIEEKTGDLDR